MSRFQAAFETRSIWHTFFYYSKSGHARILDSHRRRRDLLKEGKKAVKIGMIDRDHSTSQQSEKSSKKHWKYFKQKRVFPISVQSGKQQMLLKFLTFRRHRHRVLRRSYRNEDDLDNLLCRSFARSLRHHRLCHCERPRILGNWWPRGGSQSSDNCNNKTF